MFKEPWQLIFATIIIPTILMVLLIAWPFLDTGRDRRLSRRPAGVALGLATPAVLIALTIAGNSAPGAAGAALTGNPSSTSWRRAKYIQDAGCTTCHNFGGGGGNVRAQPGQRAPVRQRPGQDRDSQIENGGGGMPAFKGKIPDSQIQAIAELIVGLGTGKPPSQ